MCTKPGDLVGDLHFESGHNGHSHNHHCQPERNSEGGDAYNGPGKTPALPVTDDPADDKQFGIQYYWIMRSNVVIFILILVQQI